MKRVLQYLRAEEWLSSKVTLMMGILLFFVLRSQSNLQDLPWKLISYFLFVSMFLAVSYVLNDYTDIEVDKKAGKKKIIAEMPKALIWISFVTMFLVGCLPIVFVSSNWMLSVVLITITYLLGLSYSGLGLRFKERGIWGLIECSFAQRCMPLLLILCLERIEGTNILYFFVWILISFFDGLRYIVIHQVVDMENDIKSGVRTFVAQKRQNYRNLIIAFWAAEIILLILLLIELWLSEPLIVSIFVVTYGFIEFCIYQVLNVFAGKDWFVTFDSVPLEGFLNIFFPIMTGVCMLRYSPWMLLYCVFILVICYDSLRIKINLAKIYIQSKIKKN